MKKELIVRAWKDPGFRAHLTAEEHAEVPECPSGTPLIELGERALKNVMGGLPRSANAHPWRHEPVPNPW